MSPLPSPCDGFAQAIALRADRELGPAESAALEAHLERCGSCRGRALHLERLSSVLKAWDARSAEPVRAPARLAGAVLGQVTDLARHRRAEVRSILFARVATAAAVVLVLCGALVAGVATRPDAAPALERASAHIQVPEPLLPPASPLDLPSLGTTSIDLPPASRLVVGGAAAVDTQPVDPLEAAAAEAVLAEAIGRSIQEQAFFERFGVEGVWWQDGRGGYAILVTPSVAEWMRQSDRIGRLVRDSGRHHYVNEDTQKDAGVAPFDALGIPRPASARGNWIRDGIELRDKDSGRAVARALEIPVDPQVAASFPEPIELSTALEKKWLSLREAEDGHLVAFVQGNPSPILVPLGEIIVGGEADRAVSRSVWIPPTEVQVRLLIPCVAVSTQSVVSSSGQDGTLRPTGLLAGPRIRSMLAQGLQAPDVLDVVREMTLSLARRKGIELPAGFGYSLAGLLGSPSLLPVVDQWERGWTAGRNLRGIAVEDARGRLLGFEFANLGGRAAARHFARILVAAQVESVLRGPGPVAGAMPEPPTPQEALERSLSMERNLLLVDAEDGQRLLRVRDPALAWEVLQESEFSLVGSAFAR